MMEKRVAQVAIKINMVAVIILLKENALQVGNRS
jgi:hypothetical protein